MLVERARVVRGLRGADAPAALAAAGIDGRRRPETLELVELVRLADVFASA